MFVAAVLDLGYEIFVIYIISFDSPDNNKENNIYLFYKVQIIILIANEALTSILIKYSNFSNIFSLKLALPFFKYIRINDYTIKLINKQ